MYYNVPSGSHQVVVVKHMVTDLPLNRADFQLHLSHSLYRLKVQLKLVPAKTLNLKASQQHHRHLQQHL